MWSAPVVVQAPASPPISLDEAKAQCRVTGTSHDASLNLYIGAATGLVQKWTGLALVTQTLAITRAVFEASMPLPVAPAQAVAITYYDRDGQEQTLPTTEYLLTGAGTLSASVELAEGRQWPAAASRSDAVKAEVTVGYLTVPDDIKAALLLLVSHLFDNRGVIASGAEMPWGVSELIENHRTF